MSPILCQSSLMSFIPSTEHARDVGRLLDPSVNHQSGDTVPSGTVSFHKCSAHQQEASPRGDVNFYRPADGSRSDDSVRFLFTLSAN